MDPLQNAPDLAPAVRSVVVMHRGRVVFEHYRQNVAADDLQPLNSVTKSVVAILCGIALRERVFASLGVTLGSLLPEACAPGLDHRVRHITLKQLLTMTSGFEWDEREVDQCLLSTCVELSMPGERLRFILGRPVAHDPGTRFNYDSHAAHLLSVMLGRATGCTLDQYARMKLFEPLGIEAFEWSTDEDGHAFAGRGLLLTSRAMAKLGQLMLDEGQLRGRELVTRSFVLDATRPQSAGGWPAEGARYGYLWWIGVHEFFAFGFGEQFIFVDPAGKVVAAVTSDSTPAPKHVREWLEKLVHSPLVCPQPPA
ncbi:CubicO group peptidase (beta-lactamase class C family) [Paraburkholderia sp. BL8N3]|nr:serine hydrolase [Paraburkholderia sp. BL8N3]TCK33661.1 CubicO group peptidase (beta-lactamase class C family) [Paraburkholderia sp. BL8N3]